jgi:hypothetical protein
MTLKIKFNEKFNHNGTGVASSVSWDTLKPHLEKAFDLSESEELLGLSVTESGVTAFFGRKLTREFIAENFNKIIDHSNSNALNIHCDFCYHRYVGTLNGFECCLNHLEGLKRFISINT